MDLSAPTLEEYVAKHTGKSKKEAGGWEDEPPEELNRELVHSSPGLA